jgi:hypothetical protein
MAKAPTNALALFNPDNVPDHIRKFNDENSNIADKVSVNALTYPGKIWTVAIEGSKTPLMKTNEEGDLEPRQTLTVVILDYAKRRGRSYYSAGFDPDKPQQPDCWAADGIAPDEHSRDKQSEKCATCPMAVKGSKTTDAGKDTTACQQYRMVAVALYRKWDLPPLRLRLAITSDYDATSKEHEAKGWFAFQQLTDLFRSKGIKHTAELAVKVKFDVNVNYPKVLFSPSSWLTEEETDIVKAMADSAEVKDLISSTFTPNGGDGVKTAPAEEQAEETGPIPPRPTKPAAGKPAAAKPGKPAARKPEPEPAPEPEPEPEEEEEEEEAVEGEVVDEGGEDATDVTDIVEGAEEEEDEDPEEAARVAAEEARQRALKKQQDKAAKAAQARKAAAQDDGEEGDVVMGAPQKPTGKPTAQAGKPAGKPVAQAAPAKTNGAAKPAATKTTAAPAAAGKGGTKPVSPGVAATLNEWQDDD